MRSPGKRTRDGSESPSGRPSKRRAMSPEEGEVDEPSAASLGAASNDTLAASGSGAGPSAGPSKPKVSLPFKTKAAPQPEVSQAPKDQGWMPPTESRRHTSSYGNNSNYDSFQPGRHRQHGGSTRHSRGYDRYVPGMDNDRSDRGDRDRGDSRRHGDFDRWPRQDHRDSDRYHDRDYDDRDRDFRSARHGDDLNRRTSPPHRQNGHHQDHHRSQDNGWPTPSAIVNNRFRNERTPSARSDRSANDDQSFRESRPRTPPKSTQTDGPGSPATSLPLANGKPLSPSRGRLVSPGRPPEPPSTLQSPPPLPPPDSPDQQPHRHHDLSIRGTSSHPRTSQPSGPQSTEPSDNMERSPPPVSNLSDRKPPPIRRDIPTPGAPSHHSTPQPIDMRLKGVSVTVETSAWPSSEPQAPSPNISTPKPRRNARIRTDTQERIAFARTFHGCGKLADYQLVQKIGEGTFGEVHRAMNKIKNQTVALKRIFMHNESEGIPITALREIRILKSLKHENVLSLEDMIIARADANAKSADLYMVFPYMDYDLAGLLENPEAKLTPSMIKFFLQQLLQGTEYLHRAFILHRDMKAANLLIQKSGRLIIADFGLARPFDAPDLPSDTQNFGTRFTNMVVTRWYRPPELLLGSRYYGPAVDIWGVGCIFAEMHTRVPVFRGTTDGHQFDLITRACGTPTLENWPSCPAFHPDYRPQDDVKPLSAWQPQHPRRVQRHFHEFMADELSRQLLDELLIMDPGKRVTATGALDHDYFFSAPPPAKLGQFPAWAPSHEYNKRKHAPAAQAPAPPLHQPTLPPYAQNARPPQPQPYVQQWMQQQGRGLQPSYPPRGPAGTELRQEEHLRRIQNLRLGPDGFPINARMITGRADLRGGGEWRGSGGRRGGGRGRGADMYRPGGGGQNGGLPY